MFSFFVYRKMSGPPEYDPRRLFPFGLSPIPEVPSELASEVSSVYSFACDDDESEAETEVEGTKTPGSIMYSGSCSSVKSNGTLEDKAQAIDSSEEESEDEETEEEEETDEEDEEEENGDQIIIEVSASKQNEDIRVPILIPAEENEMPSKIEDPDEKVMESEEESEEVTEEESVETDEGIENCYHSCVTAVTHQKRAFTNSDNSSWEEGPRLAIVPSASSSNLDPSPGAIAATEIFQHIQATSDNKKEVTTELAKILNVLQTTLKEDSSSSSSSSSEDTEDSKEATPEPAKKPSPVTSQPPLGKPPLHPHTLRGLAGIPKSGLRRVGPEIQQRIKELASLRPEKGGKEEMSILSKILVTLLCSCKSAEATTELRKIIRHFREAASEASDEVEEEMKPIRSSCTSSRGSKRRYRSRSRRSSANSNGSNTSQSEAESLTNTLTPCNTDSKSSGTEDEGTSGPKGCSVCHTPTNEAGTRGKSHSSVAEDELEAESASVSFTVSIPRRPSIEVAEITASISPTKMMMPESEENAEEDHEEEEEEEEEWEWEEEEDDTSSSRSRRSGKRVDSTSSRELSSEELNKEHSVASSTRKVLTEMEFGAYNSDSLCSPGHTSGQSEGVSMSEQSHESPALEGDSDDNLEEGQRDPVEENEEDEEEEEEEENLYTHLEETYRVLNGAYQIITGAQHEISTLVEEHSKTLQTSGGVSEEPTAAKPVRTVLSRPGSKLSRPASRRSVQKGEDGTEDDDWAEDEEGDWEWEYYYDEEDNPYHKTELAKNTSEQGVLKAIGSTLPDQTQK